MNRDYAIAELSKQELDELAKLEGTFKEKTGKNVVLIAWETQRDGAQGTKSGPM